jgi:transketolase
MSNFRDEALGIELNSDSRQLRQLVLEGIAGGGRGHIGPALSVLEIIDVLYAQVMRHRPSEPDWEGRDYFILSKGHACLAQYAVLATQGYFDKNELSTFCKYESRLGGHPEWHDLPGIEFSTGSLGHGLAVAVGLAIGAKLNKTGQRVYVVLGDGELGEGSIWESAMHATKHELNNLCVVVDYNDMQAFGPLALVLPLGQIKEKWESFGFNVIEVNGHSREELKSAFNTEVPGRRGPTAVIAYTIKGKGLSNAENSAIWHHKAKISHQDIDDMKASLR